jgi:phage terminase small subunit
MPLLTMSAQGNPSVSPYLQIMQRCTLLMARLGSEMGFSPSSRVSLGVPALPSTEVPTSPHQLFDTVLPDGTRLPYGKSS